MKTLKSILLLGLFCMISLGASAEVLPGDANNDGSVNVNDISTIATYILNGKATPWNEKNADANGDGTVNVNDISATATIILGGEGGDETHVYLKCPDDHHPHAIDLGLPSGTKWCCCNVGASTPEGYGGYYAWGETSEKSMYDWNTYKWCNGSYSSITKYCTDSYYGNVDGKTVLDLSDDVAHVRMGGSWHMPSTEQQRELINNCTQTWTQQNGVNGILVTGKNGGQIFLPAAGYRWGDYLYDAGSYGDYWSSSLSPGGDYYAYYLYFDSGSWYWYNYDRNVGHSVRAVCP